MAPAEHPDFPIDPETGQPARSPEDLRTSPELDTARRGRIETARQLLDGRCGYERYSRRKGEPDPDELSGHRGTVAAIQRNVASLSLVDQELLKAVFPEILADPDSGELPQQPRLDDPDTLERLAQEFDSSSGRSFRREVDIAIEHFADRHYPASVA